VFAPYTFSAYDREHGNAGRNNWQGSLLESSQDKSGLQFRRHRYYDPQTGRFTQEDPIGLAGGLNLYGFAGGDPVNFGDPFGLKVCFGEQDRKRLVQGVEHATGTSIALDKAGCVESFKARKKKGFEGLQRRFGELVGREETYSVVAGTLQRSAEYNGDTRTATVDFGRLATARYPVEVQGVCLPSSAPLTNNRFSLGAVLAHELGHAYNGVSNDEDADERGAVAIENEYHAAAGESARCAYEVDLSH